MDSPWQIIEGPGPIIATAIHNGHEVRPEVEALMALEDDARQREEDPFTGAWTAAAQTQVLVDRSRFEVDLNRPRERSVYLTPADAWGLTVWRTPPSTALVDRSLAQFDDFYEALGALLDRKVAEDGHFVVLDLHSYNHRRAGPDQPPMSPIENPEVNIGTRTMDRTRWSKVIDRFIADLGAHEVGGRPLDVRENIKFYGGHLALWVHGRFPTTGCVLSVEFKKIFMDEWSGVLDEVAHAEVAKALQATIPGLIEALRS